MERARTPRAISIIRAGGTIYGQKKMGGTMVWTPGGDGVSSSLTPEIFCAPEKHRRSQNNPVDGEDREAVLAHPVEEPLDHAQCDDERDHEADDEHDPVVVGHDHVGRAAAAGENLFFQI